MTKPNECPTIEEMISEAVREQFGARSLLIYKAENDEILGDGSSEVARSKYKWRDSDKRRAIYGI